MSWKEGGVGGCPLGQVADRDEGMLLHVFLLRGGGVAYSLRLVVLREFILELRIRI